MGIADEIGGELEKKPEARFRKLLAEVEGARRFFSRWRTEADEVSERMQEVQKVLEQNMERLQEQAQRVGEAEDAANVLALQISTIDEFINENFRDVFLRPPSVKRATDDPGQATDEKPTDSAPEGAFTPSKRDRDALMGKTPQTTADKTLYLLGELKKIRDRFGGSFVEKMNRMVGGQE